jgi:hypothetical protein
MAKGSVRRMMIVVTDDTFNIRNRFEFMIYHLHWQWTAKM